MTTETTNNHVLPWPSAATYKRSIHLRFSLYVVGLVLVLMLATGLVVSNKLVTTVTQNVVDKLLVQARSYAGAAAKQIIAADGPDVLTLTDICKKLMGDDPDFGWAGIANDSNRFLAHTDMRQVISESRLRLSPTHGYASGLRAGEVLQVSEDSIMVAVPITEQGVVLGVLAMASSTEQIRSVRESALLTIALITLIISATGVPLTALVLRRQLKPLRLITESLRKVEIGNLALEPPVNDRSEFGFLADTLRVMGTRLQHAQKQAVETDRMTRELEIAREIQANILPKEYPTGTKYQFSGMYRSAQTVGGDYYDFIELGAGKLGILIADVSGKSLPGMLVMLLTRDLVLKHARQCETPVGMLSAVNRELLPEVRKGTFVTMLYGILDTNIGRFDFASAGHNPLIHVASESQQHRLIKTKGYPLGMMSATQFDRRIESAHIQLGCNDWCILYTDGINEAMDEHNKQYGMDRFLSLIDRCTVQSAVDLTRSVVDDVFRFVGRSPQTDDITLLSLKWTDNPVACVRQQSKEATHVPSH